jgi:MFS family permease
MPDADEKETAPAQKKPLHPVVKATGFVSFFTDLGSEMIYPLLPILITVEMGATKALFGLIEGIAEGLPPIIGWFSGILADRVKDRKWLILGGYSLSSVAKPLIGTARFVSQALGPWVILALRVVDKIGKGIRGSPRNALVADYAETERGRAFGFQRAMDHAGAVGGGLAAWFFISQMGLSIWWVFAIAVVPGLLTILTIVFFIKEKQDRRAAVSKSLTGQVMAPGFGRRYYTYLVAVALFALANSSDAFLILRAREMGLAVGLLPLTWAVLHVSKAVTSYYGGGMSDRVGRKPMLVGGWLLYAAVYSGFAWLNDAWMVWPLFVVYGLFFGMTEGVAKAYVADLVPAGARGRAFGLLGMIEGICLVATSVAVGWLWDEEGAGNLPLSLGAVFALAAAAWMMFAVKGGKAKAEEKK